ncbi:MAG TPA: DUF502 domain-containing protein [Vicinamibacterales bacterium]|jgi:uncharacterized membrane protein|nr:DUF502 domain-containing protein [Vicinamibacterales bacterium]
MWQTLRRTFLTGFFVTVPLVVSVLALVWIFRGADRLTSGLGERVLGVHVPGLGILATAVFVLAVGAVATNVFGRRVLQRGEQLLLHVPLFRTIYAPVKQLITAFAPDNEVGFKRMVLVEEPPGRFVLGFLMKEFTVDRGRGLERLLAIYVPTNHLYLGDIVVCPPERASYPELSVEEGVRVFLTGGMGLPDEVRAPHEPTHGSSPTA